jgi:hypothetical protein
MRNEFTAIIEHDEEWFVAWSPEIPGAMARGARSKNADKVLERPSS